MFRPNQPSSIDEVERFLLSRQNDSAMMLQCSRDLAFAISAFLIVACQFRPVLSDRNIEPRIVGGSDAVPGEFPFFVQWGGCGGSLIHEDIILTAAH
eukprot:scaffold5159_cov112-Cylindrotheca_fusiformis.AAC.1